MTTVVVTSRVRGWRGSRRVRCVCPLTFAVALSPAPIGPFPPPALRTGTCGFPASGSPVGSCISHAERPFGALLAVPAALRAPGSQKLHGFTRAVPLPDPPPSLFTPGRHRASFSPAPSLYACDASELSAPSRGVRRQSHSRRPSSLRHPSTPEAPFLDGHYPASSVLRASPPPCRPSLPLAGFRLPRARHRQGFPCCYAFHLPCMPTPLPRRKPAGALVALFPAGRRPSPVSRRVDFRNNRFEACSAFTRVPACMVAEPPKAALLPECFSPYRYPSRNDSCWVGFAPTRKARLSTAHWKVEFTFRCESGNHTPSSHSFRQR